MKILHVCSDWKWTGPAEPMLAALGGLRERGHEVALACPEPPHPGESGLATEACARGIEPALVLERGRGIRWGRDSADARRLRDLVERSRFDVLHAWHSRCHALALRAAGWRASRRSAAVVRSFPAAGAIPDRPWNRWLFGPGCDGLHCPSPASAAINTAVRRGRPISGVLGAVSPARLTPGDRGRGRRSLGLPAEAPVVGIASRVQRHRRFDLLLAALVLARRRLPELRLVILGRGTHRDEIARRPALELGVDDRVVLAGHRTTDYADALAALDVFTLVVPGSDGTCRALLEAQVAGLPAVVSRRGALPEIVVDGETGRVVDETPEAFAGAWCELVSGPGRREAWGRSARERAVALFTPGRLAADLESLYRDVLAERAGADRGQASRESAFSDSSTISR